MQFAAAEAGQTYTGDVSIPNNDPDENPYTFRITGSVTPGQPVGVIAIEPDALEFGRVARFATGRQFMYVGNHGKSPLNVTSIDCPAGFAARPQTFTVAAGGYQTVCVSFTPARLGNHEGSIRVNCDSTGGGTPAIGCSATCASRVGPANL